MTYRFLKPDIRVALDRISNYAETCWTVYDQHRKGKLPLEAAVSRIHDLYYEAHALPRTAAPRPPASQRSSPRSMDLRAYPPAHSQLAKRPFHTDTAGSPARTNLGDYPCQTEQNAPSLATSSPRSLATPATSTSPKRELWHPCRTPPIRAYRKARPFPPLPQALRRRESRTPLPDRRRTRHAAYHRSITPKVMTNLSAGSTPPAGVAQADRKRLTPQHHLASVASALEAALFFCPSITEQGARSCTAFTTAKAAG